MSSEPSDPSAALDRLAAAALRVAAERRRTPVSTYRFQFHKDFTLNHARALVPYLQALGVSHVYMSPILKARPGSLHGYDVLDHGTLNPEVGTEEEFAALAKELRGRGMGIILDAVPNHMCIGADNPWWADVLQHGPSSPFADFFDIAWFDSPRPGMSGRLLLPLLGEPYGTVLESGQLKLVFENGAFEVRYFDNRFPIDPRTYGLILAPARAALLARLGLEHPDALELVSVVNQTRHMPPRMEANGERPRPERITEARVEAASLRHRLTELDSRHPEAAAAVRAAVERMNGTPGDPVSFGPLDELLEAQAYRLCFWRVASDEINYRRFFDVNDLAAVSTEREDVFRAVHRKLLAWLAAGLADGLRIDHPDGLFDPKQYLQRLQSHYLLAVAKAIYDAEPAAYPEVEWERDEAALLGRFEAGGGRQPPDGNEIRGLTPPARQHPLYVVVEKILGETEPFPDDWPCEGATGYKLLNAVNNLFVDPAAEQPFTRLYQEFTGLVDPFLEVAYDKKMQTLASALSSEMNALAYQLDRLARLDRRSRDFTLNGTRRALREVIAAFPVYRSYVDGHVRDGDKMVIGKAVRRAGKRNPLLGRALFDFIRDTLLLKDSPSGPASENYRDLQKRFAGKFQQVTAPVTAKGIEDTAFYVYNRFVSLNEVGGEPGRFGWPVERVHKYFAARQERVPGALNPLSTHDSKRGEDVRARLNVLSELPGEWSDRVRRWAHLNRDHKTELEDGTVAPDANEEYFLYQTLIGTWPGGGSPEYTHRIQEYVKKALAEAKVHTSWINPDPDYEAAVTRFVDRLLSPETSPEFLADLAHFSERVAFFGRVNSLAQTVLRCTAPGVPDTYQGTEVWTFSLVDPDNRRPVDYDSNEAWLQDLDVRAAGGDRRLCQVAFALAKNLAVPRAKLFTTAQALRCRRANVDLFAHGEYVPLTADGPKADHVFAFLRRRGDAAALVVVPRLSVGLVPTATRPPIGRRVWEDTALKLPEDLGGEWVNAFTGEALTTNARPVAVAEALGVFPVAVLVRRHA